MRLEPDRDHEGSPVRSRLTGLFAVVGPDALMRCCRLGEEVLRFFVGFLDVLHGKGEFDWPEAPFLPSTRGQVRGY